MKKFLLFLTALFAFSVVLTACGDDGNDNNNENNTEENNQEENDNNENNNDNDVNNLDDNNEDNVSDIFGGEDNNNDGEDNSGFFGNNDETNSGNEDDNQTMEEDGERSFVMEEEGIVIKLTYYHEGDQVIKQTAENIITYEEAGVADKEAAKELYEPESEKFQGIDGVTEEMEYSDSELTETMEVDYEEAELDEISDLPGMIQDGNTADGISMEKSAEMLINQGFEEE